MLFKNLSAWWWNYIFLTGGISKFELKRKTIFKKPALSSQTHCQVAQAKAQTKTCQ